MQLNPKSMRLPETEAADIKIDMVNLWNMSSQKVGKPQNTKN